MVKSPVPDVPSMVRLVTVDAAFESKPELMVTKPEIVGVAVHEVGETVKAEPVMVVAYEALPKVTAADRPWNRGEFTEVENPPVPVVSNV